MQWANPDVAFALHRLVEVLVRSACDQSLRNELKFNFARTPRRTGGVVLFTL